MFFVAAAAAPYELRFPPRKRPEPMLPESGRLAQGGSHRALIDFVAVEVRGILKIFDLLQREDG